MGREEVRKSDRGSCNSMARPELLDSMYTSMKTKFAPFCDFSITPKRAFRLPHQVIDSGSVDKT